MLLHGSSLSLVVFDEILLRSVHGLVHAALVEIGYLHGAEVAL